MSAISPRDADPIVVFLHIPKTAGNTMRAILEATYGPGYLDAWVHTSNTSAHEPVTVDAAAAEIHDLVNDIGRAGPSVRCLGLNLPYGIHRYLNRPTRYFTFVRHPVERCISRWYFSWKMRDERPMWRVYESMNFDLERILESLVDFLLVEDQVRNIIGRPVAKPLLADLELACEMVEREYYFVGTMERFDECLARLRWELSWPEVDVERRNVGDRSDPGLLPPGAVDLFAAFNQLDTALYEFVDGKYLEHRLAGEVPAHDAPGAPAVMPAGGSPC
jgi:Sulfotransferase family